MKEIYGLDEQLDKLVKSKQKEFGCAISIKWDEETDHCYMDVLTLDCRLFNDILIAERSNKDKICVGIMKWFRDNKDKF